MSSFNKNEINIRVVENMDIQTLQSLLLRDLELDGGLLDDELRTVALRTLSINRTESGEVYPDAEASLEKFRAKHPECITAVSKASFCTRHKRLMRVHNAVVRTAAVFAAVIVMCTMPVSAGEADPDPRAARWTDGEFWFDWTVMDVYPMKHSSIKIDARLDKLSKLLSGYVDEPENLLPSYLPEGFAVDETKMTNDTEWFAGGMCWLSDGESGRHMTVGCQIVYDKTMKFGIPKNSVAPERYVRNGITHYIMPNAGYYEVVWVNGNVQCSIGAQVSHDEMIKIIDSVYGDVK